MFCEFGYRNASSLHGQCMASNLNGVNRLASASKCLASNFELKLCSQTSFETMCSNIEIANGSNWLGLRLITSKIIILSSQIGVAHSRHGSLKWFQWNPVKCKLRDPNGEIWMAPEIADPLKRSLYNENFISTFNGIRMIPITPKPNRFDEPNGVRMKLLGKEGRRECARDRLKWISEENVQEEWPVGISSEWMPKENAQWEYPKRMLKNSAHTRSFSKNRKNGRTESGQ